MLTDEEFIVELKRQHEDCKQNPAQIAKNLEFAIFIKYNITRIIRLLERDDDV